MAIFTTGTLVAVSVMAFHYMGLPNYLFGVGHYRVTLHLPAAAGLYSTGNVTYRGTEVGGLGPELSRWVKGTPALAIDARKALGSLVTLTDQSQPVLDSQTDSADSIAAWAANVATVPGELKAQDPAVSKLLNDGPGAA